MLATRQGSYRGLNRWRTTPGTSHAPRLLMLLHHPGGPVPRSDVWSTWPHVPFAATMLAASALLYVRGARRTWTAAGRGHGIPVWRARAFVAGIFVLGAALLTPLDPLSETLFSAHMVQHLLLMGVAPPLIALGVPGIALLRGLPRAWSRAVARQWVAARALRAAWTVATTPICAWVPYAAALWAWHMTGPYQLALEHDGWHAVEHCSFAFTALLFWTGIVRAHRDRRSGEMLLGLIALFATVLQSGALGAMLTFSTQPWFPVHGAGAALWGITALDDQQLAGLIMWVPGGMPYVAGAIWLLGTLLREQPTARVSAAQVALRPQAR